MKWNYLGLASLLTVAIAANPVPADACGIKLVIKTSTPHRAIARSSNPSHILLLGTPPHRLERELAAAGHDVEIEPNPADAKRPSYAIVVVDASTADSARAKYPEATIVVRSGDVATDISSVENTVSRRPTRTDEHVVVAARESRAPIAAGPTANDPKKVVATGGVDGEVKPDAIKPAATPTPTPVRETPPAPTPTPAVARVEPVKEPVRETSHVKEPRAPREVAARETVPQEAKAESPAGIFRNEVYFGLGASAVNNNAALTKMAHYLADHPDVNIMIEGYADPTGNADANMTLSQTRAESVREYLVAAGVDRGRTDVAAFGDTKLKYGRSDGRNRRVAVSPKQ